MAPANDFQSQWRDRLASGSRLVPRALSQVLKDDPTRLVEIAPLLHDPVATVRLSTLRAFEDVAASRPADVAPYARPIVEALAAPEADAQESALGALAHIAPHASAEAALALPLIADLLRARRPGLREQAARCLGRLGHEVPASAPHAAGHLGAALLGARNPKAAHEAREILAALEGLVPNLTNAERTQLAPVVAPLRAHPNIQVRERAGRLARQLAV